MLSVVFPRTQLEGQMPGSFFQSEMTDQLIGAAGHSGFSGGQDR